VKENSFNVLFINSFKEQQAQITKQQEQISQQQNQIQLLKKLVCADHPNAEGCK
jgi:hypothetical protein